jgi:uncharacterized repeat protein (TIGR03803 family)
MTGLAPSKGVSPWGLLRKAGSALWLFFAILIIVAPGRLAQAQTYTVLHSFGLETDGATPDGLGHVPGLGYVGATLSGGTYNLGTVFTLFTEDATWDYEVIHDFSGPDGTAPYPPETVGGEIAAATFGTTEAGGNYTGENSYGTVYEFDREGAFSTVYKFCAVEGCPDGSTPSPDLVSDGLVYGTTWSGGANNAGTIFAVDATGSEDVVYSFEASVGGASTLPMPSGLFASSSSQLLYGTTEFGGSSGYGTLFFYDTSTGEVTTVHTFTGPPDGEYPTSGVIYVDPTCQCYYGTTLAGGEYGYGTIFKISSSGVYSVVHNFAGTADGNGPGPLATDGGGDVFGTAGGGGANSKGTLFELSSTGAFSVLYAFCQQSGCTDGSGPLGSLYSTGIGYLYGTTQLGGAYNKGVAYQFQP